MSGMTVFDDIKQQLQDAGYSNEESEANAHLWNEFFETQATNHALTAYELYQSFGVSIVAAENMPTTDNPVRSLLHQFAGVQSKTADFYKLANAERLLAGGIDINDIRKQTGWHKAQDGHWRYEISDHDASLSHPFPELKNTDPKVLNDKIDQLKRTPKINRLANVLDHPSLYAAYPGLKNYNIVFSLNTNTSGFYADRRLLEIGVQGCETDVDLLFKRVMHEVQHGIQVIENHAIGGSPEEFVTLTTDDRLNQIDQRLKEIEEANPLYFDALNARDEYVQEMASKYHASEFNVDHLLKRVKPDEEMKILVLEGRANKIKETEDSEEINEYYQLTDELRELSSGLKSYSLSANQQYMQLLGEVEAHDTAYRSTLSPDERNDVPPYNVPNPTIKKSVFWDKEAFPPLNQNGMTKYKSASAIQARTDRLETNIQAMLREISKNPLLESQHREQIQANYSELSMLNDWLKGEFAQAQIRKELKEQKPDNQLERLLKIANKQFANIVSINAVLPTNRLPRQFNSVYEVKVKALKLNSKQETLKDQILSSSEVSSSLMQELFQTNTELNQLTQWLKTDYAIQRRSEELEELLLNRNLKALPVDSNVVALDTQWPSGDNTKAAKTLLKGSSYDRSPEELSILLKLGLNPATPTEILISDLAKVASIDDLKVFFIAEQKRLRAAVKPENKTLFQFAGPNASQANHSSMLSAIQMEESNVDMNEIWRQTGWWRDINTQQWRFENSDYNINFNSMPIHELAMHGITKLPFEELVTYPSLTNNYPELAENLTVDVITRTKAKEIGINDNIDCSMDYRDLCITLILDDSLVNSPGLSIPDTAIDGLRAKVQDCIDAHEGFGQGMTSSITDDKAPSLLQLYTARLEATINRKAGFKSLYQQLTFLEAELKQQHGDDFNKRPLGEEVVSQINKIYSDISIYPEYEESNHLKSMIKKINDQGLALVPSHTNDELKNQLGNRASLTEDERRELPPWVPSVGAQESTQTTLFQSAYHGSPFLFDAFDTGHSITESRSNVYGYGSYFSSSKEYAEFYAKQRKDDSQGTELNKAWAKVHRIEKRLEYHKNVISAGGYWKQEDEYGNTLDSSSLPLKGYDYIKLDGDSLLHHDRLLAFHQRAKDEARTAAESLGKEPKGHLYLTDIPNPEHLLDWDTPLSKQHPYILELLHPILEEMNIELAEYTLPQFKRDLFSNDELNPLLINAIDDAVFNDSPSIESWATIESSLSQGQIAQLHAIIDNEANVPTGEDLYWTLAIDKGGEKEASSALNQLGVNGIKYAIPELPGENNKHNFVIFDDSKIMIKNIEPVTLFQGAQSTIDLGYFSHLYDQVSSLPFPKGRADQILNYLKNNGVKNEEIVWSGIADLLEPNPHQMFTVSELTSFLEFNDVSLTETTFHNEHSTYESYSTQTGLYENNYREILLKYDQSKLIEPHEITIESSPVSGEQGSYNYKALFKGQLISAGTTSLSEDQLSADILNSLGNQAISIPNNHFQDQANIIAHARIKDAYVNGEKVMIIDEIQSDFFQDNQNKASSDLPFQKSWADLMIKRLMVIAQKENYEHFLITDGNTQNKRYDNFYNYELIAWNQKESTLSTIVHDGPDSMNLDGYKCSTEQLPQLIGKEAAEDLLHNPHETSSDGIKSLSFYKTPKTGLSKFYDEILPNKIRKVMRSIQSPTESLISNQTLMFDSGGKASGTLVKLNQDLSNSIQFGMPLFQQDVDIPEPRGAITFDDSLSQTLIMLGKSRDASTFIHESAHFYLEAFKKICEESKTPSAQQLKDWQTILDWLQVKKGSDIGVKEHEKWARGVEKYCLEGKTTSEKLVPIFEKFKNWLGRVYENPAVLDVNLTPEVRGAMDRLFSIETRLTDDPEPTLEQLSKLLSQEATASPTDVYRELKRISNGNLDNGDLVALIGKENIQALEEIIESNNNHDSATVGRSR